MAEEAELIEISGRISSVIYTNEENGWTVLRLDTLGRRAHHRCRHAAAAYPGEELRAYGEWATHPNHGRQFKAEYAERSPAAHGGGHLFLPGGSRREGRGPGHGRPHRGKVRRQGARRHRARAGKADGDTRHHAAQSRADRRRLPAAVRTAAADGTALLPTPCGRCWPSGSINSTAAIRSPSWRRTPTSSPRRTSAAPLRRRTRSRWAWAAPPTTPTACARRWCSSCGTTPPTGTAHPRGKARPRHGAVHLRQRGGGLRRARFAGGGRHARALRGRRARRLLPCRALRSGGIRRPPPAADGKTAAGGGPWTRTP